MFQHFQGCFVRQVDDAQISHSSSRCVEWKENWPETPRETTTKKETGTKSAVFFKQTIKGQNWSHQESRVAKILTLKPLNV